MKVSIILPTYNEADNIEILIKKIHKIMRKDYEVIVVDDNSPDNTGRIAEHLSNKYPVKVIHRKGKLGLSTAVIDGFKSAKYETLCVMDADLSHPPEIIPKLIKGMKDRKADVVIGSRLIKGGGVQSWPIHRKSVSVIATLLSRPLTRVKDVMSGFFLVKKSLIENADLKPKGYKILLEIIVKTNCKNFVEVPYIFQNRSYGKTKLNSKVILNFIEHVLRLYLFKLRKHKTVN